jgi:hypothetical protein
LNFVFDVDGTLTVHDSIMDIKFHDFFLDFVKKNNVYLASNKDYDTIVFQLGTDICNNVSGVYSDGGNYLYEKGSCIYQKESRIKDKSIIANAISAFVFFGDKIYVGGPDYSLALRANKFYSVTNYQETFDILTQYYIKDTK